MSGTIVLGTREVDVDRGLVRTSGTEIALTTQQRRLLQQLVAAGGAVISRDEIPGARRGKTRPVDALVRQLRTILEDDPSEPRHLLTVRGEGYRLKLAVSRTNRLGIPPVLNGLDELLAAVLRSCEAPGWTQIVGPPGSGKTAIAEHACRTLAERLPGGAWWLDGGPCRDGDALLAAVGVLLGVRAESVLAALARRAPLALIFDGLEHVDGVEPVVAGLSRDRTVRLIGTSSRTLDLVGTTVVVPPGRQVHPESLARSWASCTSDERLLLTRCLRFGASFLAEAAVAVSGVAPSVVRSLTERWLLVPSDGGLRILPSLRAWRLEQGAVGAEPDAAFVRYVASSPSGFAVEDLLTALHDGIAVGCTAEVATLAETLLVRAPAAHLALGSAVARGGSGRLRLVAGHLAVLAGDLAAALGARVGALSCGVDPVDWPVRALDCAIGPLNHADAPDPGSLRPEAPADRVAWARLRGVATVEVGRAQEGLLLLRRSRRWALERRDRVSVLLADGASLSAMAWVGAPPEPAADGWERLAAELLALGSSYHATEALLVAARLRASLGEREAGRGLAGQAASLASAGGFRALERRAAFEALALDLADDAPQALLARIAALRTELDRRPDATTSAGLAWLACVAEARAGNADRALAIADEVQGARWGRAAAAVAAVLDPARALPEAGDGGTFGRSVVCVAAHLRGAPLGDRRAREDLATDPLVRALATIRVQ